MKKWFILLVCLLAIAITVIAFLVLNPVNQTLDLSNYVDAGLSYLNGVQEQRPLEIGVALNETGRIMEFKEYYGFYAAHDKGDFRIYVFLTMCYQEYQVQLTKYFEKEDPDFDKILAYKYDFGVIREKLIENKEIDYDALQKDLSGKLKMLGKVFH